MPQREIKDFEFKLLSAEKETNFMTFKTLKNFNISVLGIQNGEVKLSAIYLSYNHDFYFLIHGINRFLNFF